MDLTGYLLGNRYEIIEKVGDGGMATVYKAKCRLLNRLVAVKILKEEYINDMEFSKKFATEAQAAASLSHPNIVSIYDVGREGNINYIVMELIDGITLKQYIKENGKLHWREACKIAHQIAQGIEHAHKNHIIHRDIKPHNIIMSKDGQIKVTDFGIAKAVTSSTITMNRDAVGSVHYFSPEQAKGGLTTEKSDIYSLGVTMYEMLTGILPFEGESPVAVALKHVQEKPKAPCDVEITVPYSVSNIVMKAMQKDITLRYQNISDMILDIGLALNDPTKNHTNVEDYKDFPTQRITPIKEDILEDSKTSKISELDMLIKNSREDKEIREERNNINRKNENTGKKKMNRRKKKILVYSIASISAIILFTIAFIGGLYLTGAMNRAKDVEIPAVTNLTVEEATKQLEGLGLKLEVEQEVNNNEIAIGLIISQSPNATMKTKKGNSIKVVVSKGPEEVKVPDVTKMNKDDAKYAIEKLGLIYEEHLETNLDIEKNNVIRQSPEGDQVVTSQSVVAVYVSNGVGDGKIKMPKLTELTEADAKKVIAENELTLKEPIVYKSEENKPDGVVLSQSIPEGSIIDIGTKISIEVNKIKVEEQVKHNITMSNGVLAIDLSKYSKDTVEIKVIDNNAQILYDQTAQTDNGIITLSVDTKDREYIQVYIDNQLAKKIEI
ncbi:MAG: Stk1 family PASTA domain-containing Ser/Thr kinase [Clostridiales bacterium]|nr:Stk1 family PASTA domain-containing Ser/Thr kinase [Clostridiales bacterium]